MNLLISAGEASGDLHGARLLAALRNARPDLTAFGMGGERLAAAGLERVVASDALSVVGISEVVEKLPALRGALARLDAEARRRRPAAAVLIDFPDFHGLLARRLVRDRVPIVYYVPPAGLGLAPVARAGHRPAGSPRRHALSVRDRDLPAPRGRRRLCRAPARRGRA